jgi:hypothetical protein
MFCIDTMAAVKRRAQRVLFPKSRRDGPAIGANDSKQDVLVGFLAIVVGRHPTSAHSVRTLVNPLTLKSHKEIDLPRRRPLFRLNSSWNGTLQGRAPLSAQVKASIINRPLTNLSRNPLSTPTLSKISPLHPTRMRPLWTHSIGTSFIQPFTI